MEHLPSPPSLRNSDTVNQFKFGDESRVFWILEKEIIKTKPKLAQILDQL